MKKTLYSCIGKQMYLECILLCLTKVLTILKISLRCRSTFFFFLKNMGIERIGDKPEAVPGSPAEWDTVKPSMDYVDAFDPQRPEDAADSTAESGSDRVIQELIEDSKIAEVQWGIKSLES
jgi:hypothetical protein